MKTDFRKVLWVRRLYRQRWFWTIKNGVKEIVQKSPVYPPVVDDRARMPDADQVLVSWPSDLPKPRVGLVQDRKVPPYWTKYARFFQNNGIPFECYDIHRSNWLTAAEPFDIIIWASEGVLPEIEEHKRKAYFLEKCGKACYPSFATMMWNEDKIYQYDLLRANGFPVIESFISHSLPEALEWITHAEYPFVTKTPTGAASLGVELVKDVKQAEAIVNEAFSPVGRRTYWPYKRQKDYVYFQKFIPNAGYDLRIIAVGNRAFGYYRDVPNGDFRASGMGLIRWGTLPEDALRLAMQIARKLDLEIVSVDMLRDKTGKLQVNELSGFIEVETPGQLRIDGIMGAYVFDSSEEFHFEPCKLWIQELALFEFFEKWLCRQKVVDSL